ncbi:MAG: class I SAM-dependent methyltransferase [Pseudomonadota bacterium]
MNGPITDQSKDQISENIQIKDVLNAPSLMNSPQKLVLFSLILGLSPKTYVEIGTAKGGSASIVSQAADLLQSDLTGVCIDIRFDRLAPELRAHLENRFKFIERANGSIAMHEARKHCGATFDIVLIDALHDKANALFDILTVLPHVSDGGVILLDDANYFGVDDAVEEVLRITNLQDGGLVSRHGGIGAPEKAPSWVMIDEKTRTSKECVWGGLRLLRKP